MSEVRGNQNGWCFAHECDFTPIADMPSLHDMYMEAMNSRDEKRKNYQRALSAALENLMSWERMARADGFAVRLTTDMGNGAPRPFFEGDKVTFVQAYGVVVDEAEK